MKSKSHILLYFLLFTFSSILESKSQWLKLSIDKTGIYEITGKDLKQAGIAIQNFKPENVLLYTTSPFELDQQTSNEALKQEWQEIPSAYTGNNSKITKRSFYRFYAEAATAQDSSFSPHHYDKYNYVFVKVDANESRKVISSSNAAASVFETVSTVLYTFHKEEEKFSPVNSGREWYGDFINTEYFQNLTLEGLQEGGAVNLDMRMISTASEEKSIAITESSQNLGNIVLPRSLHDRNDRFRRYNRIGNELFSNFNFTPSSNNIRLRWEVIDGESFQDGAYLDFYTLQYHREIEPGESQWIGSLPSSTMGKTYKLSLANDLKAWDISLANMPTISESGIFTGNDQIDLCFFTKNQVFKPRSIEKATIAPLNGFTDVEHIIISPIAFKSAAEALASYRNTQDSIRSRVAVLSDIYNTYSGGKVDPTAIRNFLREQWNKGGRKLKYAVLLGDASFDFKNNQGLDFVNTQNLIPAYQSRESLEPIYSFSSDDYYGFLDTDEGFWPEGTSQFNSWRSTTDTTHKLDIAIGRIPAKSLLEAFNVVDKIIDYESIPTSMGDWRRKVLFVADDADFNIHLRDAERFSSQLSQLNTAVEIEKLYLDAFEQKTVGNATISTDAQQALDRAINDGTWIVNFNGHGSELGWTDEKLLTISQIQRWSNSHRLPIFFTATCEYGRYDDPARVSGAELSLIQNKTGAIALLTTTRPVFASTNFTINKAFYDELFAQPSDRLGDIFKRTKNNSIRGEINRNFTLLGDPALKTPRISQEVRITEVRTPSTDSLQWQTGSKVSFSGEISGFTGEGIIRAKIYAPQLRKTTLGDGANPAPYLDFEELIFEGIQKVSNGGFSFDFVVPQINVDSTAFGKLFLYASNADSTKEYKGSFENFKIISTPIQEQGDKEGPIITMLSENSRELVLHFQDESGLNPNLLQITINDTLVINTAKGLSSQFGYESSLFETVLSTLPLGSHKVAVTASDSYNNANSETFFITLESKSTEVLQVVAYPNPASELFRVSFRHNSVNENLKFVLNIYDMKGQKLITEQRDCYICTEEIEIGTNLGQSLRESGTYLYQLVTTNLDNQVTTAKAGRFLFWK